MYKIIIFLFTCILIKGELYTQNEATVNFQIFSSETQKLMPGKLVIMKDGQVFEHGLKSTSTLACRDHTIYSSNGKGTFKIESGAYEIWFGRGMEYAIETQIHRFESGKTYNLKAILKKEINTDGFVGGDMHLHTYTFSGHGDATVEERLISCAAEGLDWAVSTDHNYVLDYAPYLDTLGLKEEMATSIGNEVSTSIGHFNTYPLEAGTEKANSKMVDGAALFQHIREIAPENVVIQVNHPRWIDTDYFNTKGLDPYFGTTKHPEWSWDFDAIEVLNETTQLGWIPAPDNKFSVIKDWINLQNHNQRITALGNSDTHSVTEMLAGVPRNYIVSSTDVPTEIDENEIAQSIKNQKVSVSSGIFVNMTANGKGIGETISPENQSVQFHLQVQAASWISCHKVDFLKNGQVIQSFDIPKTEKAIRLDTTLSISVDRDAWFMTIAYGDEPTPPILQIKKKPIAPKGFTNPIWVDAEGDGQIFSVYDFSRKLVRDGIPDSIKFWMDKMPETIPYIFKALFEQNDSFTIEIANSFLQKADTEQKLMLYRELSKLGTPEAELVLQKQKEGYLTPLEEVSLEWYLHFPLSNSRIDNFKHKKNEILDEQLSYLEREFLYVYAGSVKRKLSLWQDEAESTKEVYLSKDGILKFVLKNDDVRDGTAYLRQSFFAMKDTFLIAYLRTNSEQVVLKNGGNTTHKIFNNLNAPIEEKVIKIPLTKRWNHLQFWVNADETTEFSFLPISNKFLLKDIENIEESNHLALNKSIKYHTQYSPKYHGFGEALTDGLRGKTSHTSQLWQGWNASNMEVEIDLGAKTTISGIEIGLLSNHKSWIFFPTKVEAYISKKGKKFKKATTYEIAIPKEAKPVEIFNLDLPIKSKKKVRFVKVIAHRLPQIPEWHNAAGSDGSWIFADELVVY